MPRDTNSGRSRRAPVPLEPSAAAPAGSRIDQIEWREPASLVPYSGSGPTLVACERSGRRCRAIEISSAYVDVAILRWQQVTGQDAIRQATGETFNAMRAARR